MRLGCLGMGTLDVTLSASSVSYEHDAVTVVDDVTVSVGGKGIVAAVALEHAGANALPMALVGANSRLPSLLPPGLSCEWLTPALERDSQIWASVADVEHVVTWVAPGPLSHGVGDLAARGEGFVLGADALYLTMEELPLIEAALGKASDRGIPVAVDLTTPLLDQLRRKRRPDLLRKLVDAADVIFCNSGESARALQALGAKAWSDLRPRRLQEVVVTAAAEGGSYSRRPFTVWRGYEAVPANPARCAVGAGDTFNGGFLAARWLRGRSLDESCEAAAALASLTVSRLSSSLAGRD